MRVATIWLSSLVAIVAGLLLWLNGSPEAVTALFALTGALVFAYVGKRFATPADMWLAALLPVAFATKLIASIARYAVLELIYHGAGDASRYHAAGSLIVHAWRDFTLPPLEIGTRAVEATTGFLYVPYVPTKLGGFFLFAMIAFTGQILLYAAFRVSAHPRSLKLFAAAIFFLPTIVYWPSSIGKESVMYLFFGLAALGAARLLESYELKSAMLFGIGVVGAAAIRPHVAVLLIASLAFAVIVGKGARARGLLGRKMLAVIMIAGLAFVAATATTAKFAIDFSEGAAATEEIGAVFEDVQQNTNQGGSSVAGSVVRTPLDFPAGTLKVLFRPFPNEANNLQSMASSIEGVLLFALLALRFFPMLRNGIHARGKPYMLFSFAFTVGFIIAFSSFNNFGLLARQRSQVMPFFIALLIGLGWAWRSDGGQENTVDDDAPHAASRVIS